MPSIKLIGSLKSAFNAYLISKVKVNGLSVESHIEKEAERRSRHWRKEKDEFAHALQEMHNQNSANLNKARDLEAIIANQPNKKQIFNEFLKQQVKAGVIESGQRLYVEETAGSFDLVTEDDKTLAKKVSLWWEDAQYWESRSGRNMFDEAPDFVAHAILSVGSINNANS